MIFHPSTCTCIPYPLSIRSVWKAAIIVLSLFLSANLYGQQPLSLKVPIKYLNIPIGSRSRLKLVTSYQQGREKRVFPVQLAKDSISFWIFIDVSEFKGQEIILSCHARPEDLKRIEQAEQIKGSDSLYKERNRPQFHLTVKRGWSNDINGPIYYHGRDHLFWQAFLWGCCETRHTCTAGMPQVKILCMGKSSHPLSC